MRKVLLTAAIAVLGLSVVMNAAAATHHQGHAAFSKRLARNDVQSAPSGLAIDCTLASGNLCAGWIWEFSGAQGDIWGVVFNPADCPISCDNGGKVEQILLRSYCSTAPGHIDGYGISSVDGADCRTASLYSAGPQTITHCVSGDRWTTFAVPDVHVNGNPFAVTITWAAPVGTTSNPQLAAEATIANLYCHNYPSITGVFPGCAASPHVCDSWALPAQRTFVYVSSGTDFCATYGVPYPLAFPYLYPYGYLPNNLIVSAGLDCFSPSATESGSWGHVKSLYQ